MVQSKARTLLESAEAALAAGVDDRWCRVAQPPAVGWHPFGMGLVLLSMTVGVALLKPPAVGWHLYGMWLVLLSMTVGVALLNHRLWAGIPTG